jgi:hypothetical protein
MDLKFVLDLYKPSIVCRERERESIERVFLAWGGRFHASPLYGVFCDFLECLLFFSMIKFRDILFPNL